MALDALYIHNDPKVEGLYFMPDLPEEFFDQIKNMSQTKDWQTSFEQWKPNSGRIDWFDVIKMCLATREFLGDPRLYKVPLWSGRIPQFAEKRIKRIIERQTA